MCDVVQTTSHIFQFKRKKSSLFVSFSHPSDSRSPINTEQLFHILRWREKTAGKMTIIPKTSRRNGVKARVGQRSPREKVNRKEDKGESEGVVDGGKEEAGAFE